MKSIHSFDRCDIPVVIMGETGCGKTSLIKFMCALQRPTGVNDKNMVLMKVSPFQYLKETVKLHFVFI